MTASLCLARWFADLIWHNVDFMAGKRRQRREGGGAAGALHLSWNAQFLVFEPLHDAGADVVESAEAE